MRCSLSFVVAALAATVAASDVTHKVPRDLVHRRFDRRSPAERQSITEKDHIKAKCSAIGPICDSFAASSSQFQSFQTFSSFTFQQQNGVFPFAGAQCFSGITNVQTVQAGFAAFTTAIANYGAFVAQQQAQLQVQIFIRSFQNLCQTLAVFVQTISSFGQIAGASFVTIYFQFLVSVQGFMSFGVSTYGFQNVCQMAGGYWSQFTTLMTTIIRIGVSWNLFADPSACIGQGFNLQLWSGAWGFNFGSFLQVQSFASTQVNVATFASSSSAFQLGSGFQCLGQSDFFQRSDYFSSQSTSIQSGGTFINGGGRGFGGGGCTHDPCHDGETRIDDDGLINGINPLVSEVGGAVGKVVNGAEDLVGHTVKPVLQTLGLGGGNKEGGGVVSNLGLGGGKKGILNL